jgi:hypothetical protein
MAGPAMAVFSTKSRDIPFGDATIWPQRVLYYSGEQLAGVAEHAHVPSTA